MDTTAGKELKDASGQKKIFVGEAYDFRAYFWPILRYPDEDWEDLNHRQEEQRNTW